MIGQYRPTRVGHATGAEILTEEAMKPPLCGAGRNQA